MNNPSVYRWVWLVMQYRDGQNKVLMLPEFPHTLLHYFLAEYFIILTNLFLKKSEMINFGDYFKAQKKKQQTDAN